jgi:dTMP kinase
MFVTFEGGEGCGKSTQARLLKDYLEALGKKVVLTREPGGTEVAESLRKVMLEDASIKDPLTELMVISAARRDHVINLIKPALEEGKIVICDRFIDSSYVYQGLVKGLSVDKIQVLTNLCTEGYLPTHTLIFDLDPQIALSRIRKDRQTMSHYDNQSLSFHQKIREGFLDLAKKNHDRISTIDASKSKEEVFLNIKQILGF